MYDNMMEVVDDDDEEDGSGSRGGRDGARMGDGAPVSANLEISISFQPQSASRDSGAAAVSVPATDGAGNNSSAAFVEEASRLVAAAATADSRPDSRSESRYGDMRPPARRPPEDAARSSRTHAQHASSVGASSQHRRAYESIFDQANISNEEEAMSGYDSALDMYDAREHEELANAGVSQGDNDNENDDDGGSGWVTVNHNDDEDDGDEDEDYHDDEMDEDLVAQMHQHQHQGGGRGSSGGSSRGVRPRLPDIIESFYEQAGNGGMGGGAVRIAGDDLMSFLGTLPIPDFLRDSLTAGSHGGMRHVLARMPMNGETGEHGDGVMIGFGGGQGPGGYRDALQSLVRSGRGGSLRGAVVREGTTSNAAPSRHPLLDISSDGAGGRGSAGRPRGGSFVDAIISAVEGGGGARPDGALSAAQTQEMKSITTQRRRLLGSLISERRWGTDVGDRDVSITRLNAIGQSVVNFYKSTSANDAGGDSGVTSGKRMYFFQKSFFFFL
jgi:hypothetical protein